MKNFYKILLIVIFCLGTANAAKASFASSSASASTSSTGGNFFSSSANATSGALSSASAQSFSSSENVTAISSSQVILDELDSPEEPDGNYSQNLLEENEPQNVNSDQSQDLIDISAINLQITGLDQKISANKQEIDKANQAGKKSLIILGIMSALELIMIVLLVLILIKRKSPAYKNPENISNFLV